MKNSCFSVIGLVAIITIITGCSTGLRTALVPVENSILFTGSYVEISQVDVKPIARVQGAPMYPAKFISHRIDGNAVIAFIIDESGTTTQVQCVKATDEAFASAAMAAVRQWRFTPAQKDGKIVACTGKQAIFFSTGN